MPVGTSSTSYIKDIVLCRFGLTSSKGMLLLTVDGSSGFSARARIYNAGNHAGEFGQFVPGLGLSHLTRQRYMPGLSGIDGNRTSVGIANPLDREIYPNVKISDSSGNHLADETFTVPPHSVMQINDIFSELGVEPQDNVQVEINATNSNQNDPFYAYASVVRSGTGDAIFILGASPNA